MYYKYFKKYLLSYLSGIGHKQGKEFLKIQIYLPAPTRVVKHNE